MSLLSVENLRVSYDNIKALHGLNFQIDEGEIVCIIGANGAGKSTTLRAISRMVKTESGSRMTLQGKDLLGQPCRQTHDREHCLTIGAAASEPVALGAGAVAGVAASKGRDPLLAVLPGVQIKVGLGGSNEKYVLVLASENGALLDYRSAAVLLAVERARFQRRVATAAVAAVAAVDATEPGSAMISLAVLMRYFSPPLFPTFTSRQRLCISFINTLNDSGVPASRVLSPLTTDS